RLRNTVALGAWAAWCLIRSSARDSREECMRRIKEFLQNGRLVLWGESAFPFICSMAWLFEQGGDVEQSERILVEWLAAILKKQQPLSDDPLPDPYVSAEDVLRSMAEDSFESRPTRRKAVQSYSLLPTVLLMVRRGYRDLLAREWKRLSRVVV